MKRDPEAISGEAYTKAPDMITLKECAKRTNLSYEGLRRKCISGEVAYIRMGSKYLINYDKLLEQLNGGK